MTEDGTGTARQAATPRDYRLAVPDGWDRIVLDPERIVSGALVTTYVPPKDAARCRP